MTIDANDKAALFNDYFCSTCVEDDGVTPQLPDAVQVGTDFDSIKLDANDIRASTTTMKSSWTTQTTKVFRQF